MTEADLLVRALEAGDQLVIRSGPEYIAAHNALMTLIRADMLFPDECATETFVYRLTRQGRHAAELLAGEQNP